MVTEQFLKIALYGAEWVMFVLIACSILSLSIILDRTVSLLKTRGDFPEFFKSLSNRLNSGESSEKIASWCSGQSMLEAQVAAVGLDRVADGTRSAEESMSATMISAKTKLDKGLTILGTLGNNTPFIGLFGTIIGIIQAFNALATNNSSGPEVVMAAISEALVATAVGLLVAIPAVIGYNFISRAIKTRMANSETTARIVLTFIERSSQHSSTK